MSQRPRHSPQAYWRGQVDERDGPGCYGCVSLVVLISCAAVIGAIATWLLLRSLGML